MTANNLSANTENGGTSTLSVSPLSPIFSFPTVFGEVNVYGVKAGLMRVAIISFDDRVGEKAYAVQTVFANPLSESYELVYNAGKTYNNPLLPNPFLELMQNAQAMSKLTNIIREFLRSV